MARTTSRRSPASTCRLGLWVPLGRAQIQRSRLTRGHPGCPLASCGAKGAQSCPPGPNRFSVRGCSSDRASTFLPPSHHRQLSPNTPPISTASSNYLLPTSTMSQNHSDHSLSHAEKGLHGDQGGATLRRTSRCHSCILHVLSRRADERNARQRLSRPEGELARSPRPAPFADPKSLFQTPARPEPARIPAIPQAHRQPW